MEQKTRIKGNVHYVGVNDRNKHLFEGMWPLPYGVSYNSYLIDDEMVALIDTVDICYFEVYLRKIRNIIGDRPINYLIINHMEPDHSGSIRLIKQHYPDIVIVGNKQTFGMIEGFYGVTGEQYLIKDGDFLALGRHKLRFYLTPMVHWPETMMTFDETDGILFSGDGFGCFGTLDGGFVDTRMNIDHYWGEMVRYYSNIVGKYGSPVQKALQKLGGLPISAICSTHGPVWTENITKVVGIESRGFIMGPILATRLGAGFIPIRKPGKLPAETIEESYDKEYGKDTIQIHKDALNENDVVLLHDDLLATGGTMEAACKLVQKMNPKKIYVNFIIELKELHGIDLFNKDIDVQSVLSL